MNETLVETDIWIPVPPEVAFTLVTDPVRLRRWLIIAGTIDVRVGGEVHLVVAPGAHAVGRVTAVEPARRFTYTHGWLGSDEMPPASTTVEVLLDPEAEGTRITVRHHGLPVGYEDMADGWSDFLRRLAHTAAGGHNAHDWAGGGETATAEAVLDSTLFTLLSALRQVDRLDTPTPSTDFTIAALVEHLIDNATWVASTLGIPSSVPSGPDAESRVADALWPLVRLLGSADRP
ncbi:MAG: SRPBCC domain-containing protein, partial [Propionibacteriales bacterium]|nr:SRPBCC domain-containing protein [Propionibacteriales bacterium]